METLGLEDRADTIDAATPLIGSLPELDSLAVMELVLALDASASPWRARTDADVFETLATLAAFVDAGCPDPPSRSCRSASQPTAVLRPSVSGAGRRGRPAPAGAVLVRRRRRPVDARSRLSAAAPRQTICLASGRYGALPARDARQGPLRARERAGPHTCASCSASAVDLTLVGDHRRGRAHGFDPRHNDPQLGVHCSGDDRRARERERPARPTRILDIDAPGHASPARIHLRYSSSQPSGVTVRDSLLAGGDADGIQTGSGMAIVGNEFPPHPPARPEPHTDAIQLLGAPARWCAGTTSTTPRPASWPTTGSPAR